MNRTLSIVLIVLVLVSGIGLGWLLFRPPTPKPEPPAPAVRQADGSLVLERKPPSPGEVVKPKHDLPPGAKLERVVQVKIAPKPRVADPAPDGVSFPESAPGDRCVAYNAQNRAQAPAGARDPITVDLSVVRMPDRSRRVIASSPDGEIVGGVDIPIEASPPFRERRWTIEALKGYEADRGRSVWGGSVGYSRGILHVSGGAVGSTAFVGVGLRF